MTRWIPDLLTASRFVVAVLLVVDAHDGVASKAFVPLFFAGALTDGIDGFLARRFHTASERGARLDAFADAFFYLFAAAAVCYLYPEVVQNFTGLLIALLSLQAASWVFSLIRFRRLTSYHTFLAKAWGVLLFVSMALLFAFENDILLVPMFVVGCASLLEDIAITAVLVRWQTGVPHLLAAIDLRR